MASVERTGTSDDLFGSWLYTYKWADPVLSYAFPDSSADYGYKFGAGISELNTAQKNTVRDALDMVASFTQLRFQESSSDTGATLRFANDSSESTASAYYPFAGEEGGDAFFGNLTRSPEIGNYDAFTFIHELGHMLGLEHGHEQPSFNGTAYDSVEYTVMTYSSYVGDTEDFYTIGAVDYAQSYMQLDIAALQFMYGANYSTSGEVWSGDTVYSFSPTTGEMSINGVGQGDPAGNRIFRTIWDGDGTDTYDLTNYSRKLDIDLRPGAWSTFSSAQLADLDSGSDKASRIADGNLANARLVDNDPRALIENAIGGQRNDTIIGNRAANVLDGGKGDDKLRGENGDDTLLGRDGDDDLRGGNGKDDMSGGRGADQLFGGKHDDVLRGQKGDDELRGGNGSDVIFGGAGFDRLFGQNGADVFRYTDVSDSIAETRFDRIQDFETGLDKIRLSGMADNFRVAIDGGANGKRATVATQERNGNTIVSVDADADGQTDMKVILTDVLGVTASDFIL